MRTLTHLVSLEDDGRLIKRVIRSRLLLSHRAFSEVKAANGMLLDGEAVHANRTVKAGQTITVRLPEEDASGVLPEDLPVEIVYQDKDMLVVNKPAPLACQSSPQKQGGTLENRLAHLFLDEAFLFHPVNRLDKGTSGLMVVARHGHAQARLTQALHSGDFVREYLAVVSGRPPLEKGVVDAPIGKADGATIRREVREDGRRAVTHYETVGIYGALSLVRLRLETGRTHQIRVHLRHMGCPVFGDFLYGEEDARLPGRFALHSGYLAVCQPLTGERIALSAPLPGELMRLLQGEDGDSKGIQSLWNPTLP